MVMGEHLSLCVGHFVTPRSLQSLQGLEASGASEEGISSHVADPYTSAIDLKEENASAVEEEPLSQTVKCHICQEEDSISNLEVPCACNGSLKFAHKKCVQHWCNEKGDITCEICHQSYQSGYNALPPCPPEEDTSIDIRNTSLDINGNSRVPWADLPTDILFIVFMLLSDINNCNFLDLFQCLTVCCSWRFVGKQIWLKHILPTAPWMLHQERNYNIVFNTNLYKWRHKHPCLDANDNDPSFSCSLDRYRMKMYASHNGWLLLGTCDLQPYLYNPVTAVLLQLPRLTEHLKLHPHMKFVSSSTTFTDFNCIICLKFSCKREIDLGNMTRLAFCRPASSSSWITLKDEIVEDIIFCGGHFYTIIRGGALFLYNDDIINGNYSWKKMKIAREIYDCSSRSCMNPCMNPGFFLYLVETSKGELLMIKRIFKSLRDYNTKSFSIFKLKYRSGTAYNRFDCYYWDKVSSFIDKESLLLGWNDCISVSVDDGYDTYKSNCIYFYDELLNGKLTNYGVYDLENHTIVMNSEDSDIYHCKLYSPSKLSNV